MDNNKRKNSWFLFAVVIIVSLLAGTFGKQIGNEVSRIIGISNGGPEIISKTGLTTLHRDAHIKGCTGAGASETYCTCTFNEFKNLYTPQDLKRLKTEYEKTGKLDQGMTKAAATCAYLR